MTLKGSLSLGEASSVGVWPIRPIFLMHMHLNSPNTMLLSIQTDQFRFRGLATSTRDAETKKHRWSSGMMNRCHRFDPGSIPGRCKDLLPADVTAWFLCFFFCFDCIIPHRVPAVIYTRHDTFFQSPTCGITFVYYYNHLYQLYITS